jgi:heterotetrameric sarcosine oxidase gamma subunit
VTDLIPHSTAPFKITRGPVSIVENPNIAFASLALSRGAPPVAPFGLTLPEVGKWVQQEDISAFWMGASAWMIAAENAGETDFAKILAREVPGAFITEQTDAWAVFDVSSSGGATPLERFLERLVNIDLAAFGPGRAVRTGMAHLSGFIIRKAMNQCTILVVRSAARSVIHALEEALL